MSMQYTKAASPAYRIGEDLSTEFLDEAFLEIRGGGIKDGMIALVSELYERYTSTTTAEWNKLVQGKLFTHPVFQLLMQDPLTAHSYGQPRGYAGDAQLLDMVYFPDQMDFSRTTDIGKKLFHYTSRTPLCLAIIERLKFIARVIDEAAVNNDELKVLSIASGHCRELNYSLAYKTGLIQQFVALDHDAASLATVETDYRNIDIQTTCQSVVNLIRRNKFEQKFDLIYTAGLYDYLNARLARCLTSILFDMLAPGGKLVLMNINTEYEEIGYMESYMNWSLIGRTELDVLGLADDIGSDECANIELINNPGTSSHFHALEITRS